MKEIISFASDFGLEDGSVGVVKGVINRVDSDLKINDILDFYNTNSDSM